LTYARMDGEDCVIVVLNLTPVPRDDYRIGAPRAGSYDLLLNSDELEYHGGGYTVKSKPTTEQAPMHGRDQSLVLTLPPLGTLVYRLRRKP